MAVIGILLGVAGVGIGIYGAAKGHYLAGGQAVLQGLLTIWLFASVHGLLSRVARLEAGRRDPPLSRAATPCPNCARPIDWESGGGIAPIQDSDRVRCQSCGVTLGRPSER